MISGNRLSAMVTKEFIQMGRDRMTFAMIFGIPIMQLLLFGFAINGDPRYMPAGIINSDTGIHGRTVLQGLKNSTYFKFTHVVSDEAEGRRLLARGEVQFLVNIPANFTRDLQRGKRPALLVEADATDPAAIAGGLASLGGIVNTALLADFKGPLRHLAPVAPSIDVRVHALYNPEARTVYNIVPA